MAREASTSTMTPPLRSWHRALLVGVGHDQAGIDGKAFATNQACVDARLHHALEHAAEDVAVTETLIAGTRECRVVGDLVLDAQAAEPPVRQVDLNLTTEQPLRADGKNVADDEHPDHQQGVNRRAAEGRVVRRKLTADPGQIEHASDPAHQVIVRYHLIEPELVEELFLLVLQPPHHRQPPQRIASERWNHYRRTPATDFCNKIGHVRTLMRCTKVGSIRSPRRFGKEETAELRARAPPGAASCS